MSPTWSFAWLEGNELSARAGDPRAREIGLGLSCSVYYRTASLLGSSEKGGMTFFRKNKKEAAFFQKFDAMEWLSWVVYSFKLTIVPEASLLRQCVAGRAVKGANTCLVCPFLDQ